MLAETGMPQKKTEMKRRPGERQSQTNAAAQRRSEFSPAF